VINPLGLFAVLQAYETKAMLTFRQDYNINDRIVATTTTRRVHCHRYLLDGFAGNVRLSQFLVIDASGMMRFFPISSLASAEQQLFLV
jgi:hypothetical protein